MALNSSDVTAGNDVLASEYNSLIDDIQQHTHDGTDTAAPATDGSTLEHSGTALRIKDDGVTGAKLAPAVAGDGDHVGRVVVIPFRNSELGGGEVEGDIVVFDSERRRGVRRTQLTPGHRAANLDDLQSSQRAAEEQAVE